MLSSQHEDLLSSLLSVAQTVSALVQDIPPPSSVPVTVLENSHKIANDPAALTLNIQLPQPLTSDLTSLGVKPLIAESLSQSYIRASARLKVQIESHFLRVFRACIDISVENGCEVPQSQSYIRFAYGAHFSDMVTSWARTGLAITRERLMIATLQCGPHVDTPPQVRA